MNAKKSIDVLNSLLEINNDRIEGYLTASKETKEHDLNTLFAQFIQTSQENRVDLVTEIKKLGGNPDESTLTTGKLFRVWMDLKAALTGHDRLAILSSCEYGEDAALEAYDKVLVEQRIDLSEAQQAMVNEQSNRIRMDHDMVKGMIDLVSEPNHTHAQNSIATEKQKEDIKHHAANN
ncbi:MAG: PA2169 family four-helix-bundle protein [Cytophagales bacterium]|nr:PA2169 family four-helix-bundle protein [Cytophagales bacterium]